MAGSIFGHLLKLSTFGESHGAAIGGVLDGFPSGILIDESRIQTEMNRRRPGQSSLTTRREEDDHVEFLSGIFEGRSTGAPIAFVIRNQDQRPSDYSHNQNTYRPSHADFTYDRKFGLRDHRGGGRSSARETAVRVAAGAICKQLLDQFNIDVTAWVSSVGTIEISTDYDKVSKDLIESNPVRCPDKGAAQQMQELIEQVKKAGDSVGGTITCYITGCPAGLGEPVFNKLNADLAAAIFSLPAVKGFELGSGFSGTRLHGSEHNDLFIMKGNVIGTRTNHSGGIQGGISNGEHIYFRTAFKPVSTIMKEQETVDSSGNPATIKGKGRHDPCVVPRAVPVVEAMAALVIADHLLINSSRNINNLIKNSTYEKGH